MKRAGTSPALAVVLGVAVGAAGCGGAGHAGALGEPRAIDVAPAPTNARGVASPEPASAAATSDEPAPFEVALEARRACVRSSGHVYCTGDLTSDRALTAGEPLPGIDQAVSLALGHGFGCVATRAGAVLCFGDNTEGQLGARLRAEKHDTPIAVPGITNARRVFASAAHACALLRDGTVRCWGRNDAGQTGGSTHYLPAARELVEPDLVVGLKDVLTVATTAHATCATTRAQEVTCWGRSLLEADTLGRAAKNLRPTQMPELARLEDLSGTGAEEAFCGIKNGEVLCWGELYALMPGNGWRAATLVKPGVTGARKVRVGRSHACALLFDGRVSCWGANYNGALGRGESPGYEALEPEPIKGLSSVVDIASGGEMSCAVTMAREVYCWGSWPSGGQPSRKEPLPVKMRVAE